VTPSAGLMGDSGEVSPGYTREQAMTEAGRCLHCGACADCGQCVLACGKRCIDLQEEDELLEFEAGAVVLAPGFDVWDADLAGEYGHGIYRNVLSSLEFESLLSYTGPTEGVVRRPSDGHVPLRVAFLQCVGSRDCARGGNDYCSSMCCMYATKEAVIAREREPRTETTIFYLDIRSHGKDSDKYVELAKTSGVRYVHAMVTSLMEDPVTKNLTLRYFCEGDVRTEEFDLVVLSVGSMPPSTARELGDLFGLELDEYGFASTSRTDTALSSRRGVFVAGAFQGPLEIPETVVSGSAAAADAGALLAAVRGALARHEIRPSAHDPVQGSPRVGVFVLDCGVRMGSSVDVLEVVAHARALPAVVHAEASPFERASDAAEKIRDTVLVKDLDRVVAASCNVPVHEPLFRRALDEAGLSPFCLEMVNLRHADAPIAGNGAEQGTDEALDLVRGAVAKVRLNEPLFLVPSPSVPAALVVGGGIAGMTAALSLTKQGFQVYVVERQAELGGQAASLSRTVDGIDLKAFVQETIGSLRADSRARVFTRARVVRFRGHKGGFTTTLSIEQPGGGAVEETVEHGVFILATGTAELLPNAYFLGSDDRVLTNSRLEQQICEGRWNGRGGKQVVFVQCVGSRDDTHPYCSRTCCAHTVKNALLLKERNQELEVFVLYRDIRTYGMMERHYRQARDMGVIFIRFERDREPLITRREDGSLELVVFDEAVQRQIVLRPDQVVLATGQEPAAGTEELAAILNLPLNEDRFFVEQHLKLAPLDLPTAGFYACGGCLAPKNVTEAMSQAKGAAARAAVVLSRPELVSGGVVATVDPDRCTFCLTCVRVCPFGVPVINEFFKAEIDALQCQGCGTCAAECPAKAIQLLHYRDDQLLAKVAGIMGEVR
jgi:heterodisulfide reductase subunit A-like polyferredoxin